jgi:hypothetical protein
MATTSGQDLLLPDSSYKKRKGRQITVEVNSIDRNQNSITSSNNFRWSFRRPLKDITSIELVTGCVPADLYNVTANWNTFIFYEAANATQILSLTPGQYTPTTLAAELQTRLNVASSNTYTVTYSDTTKRLTITATNGSPAEFTFYFKPGQLHTDQINATTGALESINCPATLLGFDRTNTTSVSGVLSPPYRVDVNYCIKRLYLHINADNSKELTRIEVGSGRRDCFHVLFLSNSSDGYYNLNRDTYMPVYYSAPAPISRMSSLTITIRDEFFRLVDLGNHEYSLVFEITTLD